MHDFVNIFFFSQHIFVPGIPDGGHVRAEMHFNIPVGFAHIRKMEAIEQNRNGPGARQVGWNFGPRTAVIFFESFGGGDINFVTNVYGDLV